MKGITARELERKQVTRGNKIVADGWAGVHLPLFIHTCTNYHDCGIKDVRFHSFQHESNGRTKPPKESLATGDRYMVLKQMKTLRCIPVASGEEYRNDKIYFITLSPFYRRFRSLNKEFWRHKCEGRSRSLCKLCRNISSNQVFHKSEIKAIQELKSHQGAPPKAIKGKTYWSQNGEWEKANIHSPSRTRASNTR